VAWKKNVGKTKEHILNGIALSKLCQYEDAVKAYDEALKIHPDDMRAWNGNAPTPCLHLLFIAARTISTQMSLVS
jgi:tetratricopeptide (TPR) repeat protein